ncbi:MAG: hypothetical protein C0617_11220 [Desulfuromonas sp.]|uniref:hypothetical protein n=1 Tax=Desulfuromonas sp. TaxID=892 RepID=UPI000CBA0D14|nr:hypothetical protein [Desulfuromonas sp.]PLX83492.1 MAG: hypothetical protein C0617_11220 [Desulfuromonas sp.]
MSSARRLILFPKDQFFAVVGTITLPDDPYALTIPDIFNEQSSATHWARDHMHRSGKVYLTDTEFFALNDPQRRICPSMTTAHIDVNDLLAVTDYHPDRYLGNDAKRQEYEERKTQMEPIRFLLRAHTFNGIADSQEIYRKSDSFVNITDISIDYAGVAPSFSLASFLRRIGGPTPNHMAVHLGNILHS